jgi:molybdate/tungstate transport system substrate-binding protein
MADTPAAASMRRFVAVLLVLAAAGCSGPDAEVTPLRVFVAGSLMVPFAAMEEAYEAAHPEVDVQIEGHGSIQVMRHVTEIHDEVDVAVTADAALIPMLMYATSVPGTDRPYADWYVEFATNRLALAYTPQSRFAEEVDAGNWYDVIGREGVAFGLSDPRFDAAGYRALMILTMAQDVYDEPTLLVDFLLGRISPPILPTQEGGRTVVRVPELIDPVPGSGMVMRGASIQLLALLESGDLDYAFEYESVVRQHGLEMVALPDTLNLGAEEQRDRYRNVGVRLDFRRFASVEPVFDGDVIGYGITVPTNAVHSEAAVDFVAFVLGPQGRAVMEANHHPVFDQPEADNHEALPEPLKPLTVARRP